MNNKNIGFFLRKFDLSLQLRPKPNANLYFIFNYHIFFIKSSKFYLNDSQIPEFPLPVR